MVTDTPAVEVEVSTESVDVSASQEGTVPASETAPAAEPAAPAYQPNFKYNVKGQEKEIDELFRSVIKDAETEKKVKELFEKADGIEHVKMDRKALKSEYDGFKSQVIPHLEMLHKFTSLRDKGNLGAAFTVAGITDEQVFEYALQKLQASENPHMAQLYKNQQDLTLRELEQETQLQRYKQMEIQQEQAKFYQDLDNSIAAFQDLASQVDQRTGKLGAFKEEVLAFGIAQAHQGNILTVDQATQMVANKYKQFITTAPAPASPTAAPQVHQRPATLPNAGNSNVSPIKKKPQSIDDLKKAYQAEVG